jgi:hypothetical protein
VCIVYIIDVVASHGDVAVFLQIIVYVMVLGQIIAALGVVWQGFYFLLLMLFALLVAGN